MTRAYESTRRGLEEAIAYARGEESAEGPGAVEHRVETREPEYRLVDVRAIRARTGLSRTAFAKRIGVTRETLAQWERRRRCPRGPARVLLALIEKDPGLVGRMPKTG